jgi:hypothetical protein
MAWAIGLAAYGACRLNAVRHEGAAEPAEVEHQEASAAGRVAEAGQPVPAVPHQPVWPRRGQIAAYTITAIVAGLFLILFLPAASSTAALPTEAPGPALGIDPVLAETGRLIYRRDGCAACHTQRVMAGDAGRGWGPMTGQDTPPARAAAGARRAGPDLAWVGDRFPTQREMEERLQVHGPEGPAAPHAWLFGPAPTVSGAAVAAYLASQRSSRAP